LGWVSSQILEFQDEEIKTIWKLFGKRSTTKDTSKKKTIIA